MLGNIVIKKLEAADLDQVSRFRMFHPEDQGLQIFLRKDARKSAAASLTKTYVAKIDGDKKVIGYVSIMCAEVKLEGQYKIEDKAGAEAWDYHPAVRIARLAVAHDYHGKKIGRQLVDVAIGMVLLAIEPNVGCRFLILDAKRKSIPFYEKMGFRLLDTETNRAAHTPLMFMDLKKVRHQPV